MRGKWQAVAVWTAFAAVSCVAAGCCGAGPRTLRAYAVPVSPDGHAPLSIDLVKWRLDKAARVAVGRHESGFYSLPDCVVWSDETWRCSSRDGSMIMEFRDGRPVGPHILWPRFLRYGDKADWCAAGPKQEQAAAEGCGWYGLVPPVVREKLF